MPITAKINSDDENIYQPFGYWLDQAPILLLEDDNSVVLLTPNHEAEDGKEFIYLYVTTCNGFNKTAEKLKLMYYRKFKKFEGSATLEND
jgi:hypothetical protein